jgi:hypothetical protein
MHDGIRRWHRVWKRHQHRFGQEIIELSALEGWIGVCETKASVVGRSASINVPVGSKEQGGMFTARYLGDHCASQLLLAQSNDLCWRLDNCGLTWGIDVPAHPNLTHTVQTPTPYNASIVNRKRLIVTCTNSDSPSRTATEHDLFGYGTVNLTAANDFTTQLAIFTCTKRVHVSVRSESKQMVVSSGESHKTFRL